MLKLLIAVVLSVLLLAVVCDPVKAQEFTLSVQAPESFAIEAPAGADQMVFCDAGYCVPAAKKYAGPLALRRGQPLRNAGRVLLRARPLRRAGAFLANRRPLRRAAGFVLGIR